MIKIGDTLLDASLTRSGDTLTISMVGDMTLDALSALLDPGSAPEVRVLDGDGMTEAVYKNRAVTMLAVTVAGGARQATATLQVEQLAQTEADRLAEQITRQAEIISEHDAALCEVAGMAADGQTLTAEAEDAMIELAGICADLVERVGALEARLSAPEADDEQGKEDA